MATRKTTRRALRKSRRVHRKAQRKSNRRMFGGGGAAGSVYTVCENFHGVPGQRYKVYYIDSIDPERWQFAGKYIGTVMHQGVGRSYCYHRFEDVIYPDNPAGPVTREIADRDVGEMLKVVEDK
jgi:hypothetical protein